MVIWRLLLRLVGVALLGGAGGAFVTAGAQTSRWTVVAPDAALAWFAVLADLRLPGAGALDFTVPPSSPSSDRALARALASSRDAEILHFVPLYHPSADRAALTAALRTAAGEGAPSPRATLLTGALRDALTPARRRALLVPLADALLRSAAPAPERGRLLQLQQLLDAEFGPALAPWLRSESLDEGRLIVAPSVGAEGRLIAATADRRDNLVAVGGFSDDPDAAAPLFAFTREICFPAVTRAAIAARFTAADATAARRASLAAVRCGAALLDLRLPARAAAYRAFWLRRIGAPANARFDEWFPPDPAFSGALAAAVRRVGSPPGGN